MIAQDGNLWDVVFWCTIFIVAIVAIVFAARWFRGRFLDSASESVARDALSLQQLRDMRRDGHITEDEFQTLKSQVIAQFNPREKNESD